MKGGTEPTLIHFAGNTDDWVVFIDDVGQYNAWVQEQTGGADAGADEIDEKFVVPLFVTAKDKLFVTNRHGPQGKKNSASKAAIAAEFGTEKKDAAIKQILLKGRLVESELQELQGSRNDTDGAMVAH